jgi:hypothetical protein
MLGDSNSESVRPSETKPEAENAMFGYQRVQPTFYISPDRSRLLIELIPDNQDPGPTDDPRRCVPPAKAQAQSKGPKVLSTEQVAEEIECAPKTVRKLITDGFLEALPGITPYKVTRAALDRYLSGCLPRRHRDQTVSDAAAVPVGAAGASVGKSAHRPLRKSLLPKDNPQGDETQRACQDMASWEKKNTDGS